MAWKGFALSQRVRPKRNLKTAGRRQGRVVVRVDEVANPLCEGDQLRESWKQF